MKAFPQKWTNERGNDCVNFGMTLRDYFAAKVLPNIYVEALREGAVIGFGMDWIDGVAKDAYAMADAMLKAREES